MRKPLLGVLEVFREFHAHQSELEADMQECLCTFFTLERKGRLTVRARLRPSGVIRQIYLAAKTHKAYKIIGHRKVRLSHYLSGRLNDGLLWKIAYDLEHAPEWYAADDTRIRLNERSGRVASALRAFTLALANKFASRITLPDRSFLELILETSPELVWNAPGILGAVVYDRLLRELEGRISQLVLRWKEAYPRHPFEPLIRWRENGHLRLAWAYVDRFYDAARNPHIRSQEIPGGVSDRWLREHHPEGGAARRKAILSYAFPLRQLTREYSRLLVYVGQLKALARRAIYQEINGARPVAGADAI
jgi:hypothetical protein